MESAILVPGIVPCATVPAYRYRTRAGAYNSENGSSENPNPIYRSGMALSCGFAGFRTHWAQACTHLSPIKIPAARPKAPAVNGAFLCKTILLFYSKFS